MSWNLDTGVIRFWSNAPAMHDILGEIFEASFRMSFVPESPYTAGAALGLSDAELDAFDRLDPAIFHVEPQQAGG